MPALEVNASSSLCRKCGRAYGRLKGYFPVSYGYLYKGAGYLPYCKECVDGMFDSYMEQCHDARAATKQMCRKLDLYWSDHVFDMAEKRTASRTVMTAYLLALSTPKYAGKSYDDTLIEADQLWATSAALYEESQNEVFISGDLANIEISDDTVAFWGPGYSRDMYAELEQRRRYWISQLPDGIDNDVGVQALLRQICMVEIDINRDRAAGRSSDKNQRILSELLGSAMLKPSQKKDEVDTATENTPFGVWIKRWENQKPIPEPDPELQDVDGIIRYISIWFYGHLCKMLGIKNTYCKLYEDEIAKMRVNHPEFEDDDEDTMLSDIFGDRDEE